MASPRVGSWQRFEEFPPLLEKGKGPSSAARGTFVPNVCDIPYSTSTAINASAVILRSGIRPPAAYLISAILFDLGSLIRYVSAVQLDGEVRFSMGLCAAGKRWAQTALDSLPLSLRAVATELEALYREQQKVERDLTRA